MNFNHCFISNLILKGWTYHHFEKQLIYMKQILTYYKEIYPKLSELYLSLLLFIVNTSFNICGYGGFLCINVYAS